MGKNETHSSKRSLQWKKFFQQHGLLFFPSWTFFDRLGYQADFEVHIAGHWQSVFLQNPLNSWRLLSNPFGNEFLYVREKLNRSLEEDLQLGARWAESDRGKSILQWVKARFEIGEQECRYRAHNLIDPNQSHIVWQGTLSKGFQ